MKKVLAFLLQPLIFVSRYFYQTIKDNPGLSVVSVIHMNAIKDSANFVSQNLDGCMLFEKRELLWETALASTEVPGTFVELGVWKGESISFMARKKPN